MHYEFYIIREKFDLSKNLDITQKDCEINPLKNKENQCDRFKSDITSTQVTKPSITITNQGDNIPLDKQNNPNANSSQVIFLGNIEPLKTYISFIFIETFIGVFNIENIKC